MILRLLDNKGLDCGDMSLYFDAVALSDFKKAHKAMPMSLASRQQSRHQI